MTARILPLLAVLVLAGCGGGDKAQPAAKKPAAAPGGCAEVKAPAPKAEGALKAATARVPAGSAVTLQTSCGPIVIALDTKRAPKTVAAFAGLVRKRFFDGLAFHRIVPGFVVQGGDPRGDGQGGPGYTVVEKPPSDLLYRPGIVAMAKTASDPPGASGSQFFIVSGDGAESLPPDYALVGRVTSGMSVVARMERLGSQEGTPTRPVVIEKATLSG